jgi:cytochrome c peroxidase
MKRVLIAFKIITLTLALSACGGGGGGGSTTPSSTAPATSTATQLSISQALFAEKSLSASGQLSCASCHTDETAHSTASGVSLPVGGVLMNQQLARSSPSLMYKSTTPIFSFNNAGEAIGGFDWDGRVNTLADQSAGPLLASAEMANANINILASKVRALSYFKDFASVFNVPTNATDQQVYDILRTAFETYQRQDPDYLLFNSKFDRFLDGTVTLSASEERGRQLFNTPTKGNCASCHSSQIGPGQQRPLFTNFRYAALGVPRNNTSNANQNATFFDMGLCGPVRIDLTARIDLCGQFKIPTLRNIAITAPYFHNSAIDTLTNAVRFYATRDSNPALWYPTVNGVVIKFNDLPANLRGNVPVNRAPFNSNLSAQEIDDIVAFLLTLTDDRTAPANLPTIRN